MISIKDNKIRWGISAVLALLILFGTYRNVFSLAAFLGCCLMVFFFDKESVLLQLFFVMPIANIFKLSPGSQSFFTILILLYVVLHLVLPRKATTLVILLGVYIVVGELLAGQFNVSRTIKFICNILFLSSVLNEKVQFSKKEIFLSYIVGNYVASFFGTIDSPYFKISSYTGAEQFVNEKFYDGATRFIGLHGDPNYYAVNIIISLCLIILLLHKSEIKIVPALILAVPFIYFLLQTYSKSAIVMLFVITIFLVYSFLKNKKHVSVLVSGLVVLIFAYLALSGMIPSVNIIFDRFSQSETSEGFEINTLTTGRYDLWIFHIKYIASNIKVALFGDSITAGLITHHASHNTYIDIVYHLGLTGGTLLIASLKSILSQSSRVKIKRNILNYSVLLSVVIMYFFLGELFIHDPPFHIYLAFAALNMPLETDTFFEK